MPVVGELEVAGPSTCEPLNIERRSRSIRRAVRTEYVEHAVAGVSRLAKDPVAIFAHDGDSVMHDRLPRGERDDRTARVELTRQFEVDIHRHRGIVAGRDKTSVVIIGARSSGRTDEGCCRAR